MKLTSQQYADLLREYPNLKPTDVYPNAGGFISNAQPQHHKTPALVSAIPRKEESLSRPRTRVSFTLFRVKLLDPDNAAGSVKDLLDGLRHAALIEGDEWHRIKLEVEQEKVSHYKDEKTVITIER